MAESSEMKVRITYVAHLKDLCGRGTETLETGAKDVRGLFVEIQNLYRFQWPIETLRVAVNDQLSDWSTALREHDHIVFLPPVSGG